jgi:limonene-1,2-epoxide hydrolase
MPTTMTWSNGPAPSMRSVASPGHGRSHADDADSRRPPGADDPEWENTGSALVSLSPPTRTTALSSGASGPVRRPVWWSRHPFIMADFDSVGGAAGLPSEQRRSAMAQCRTGRAGLLCRGEQRDPEVLRAFFSDDVVYHNIPMDPAEGIEATMATIDMFIGMCDALEFEIHHLASDGIDRAHRADRHFTMKGKTAPLPVMGAFHVRDGKITAWRDYFDMAQVTPSSVG